jgi:hypothetical protein
MQNVGDIFGQVFRAIWANKLRSFLTMFGIAWGVGSMLLLISVGEGFRSGQRRELATFGNDLIMMWGGTIPAVANQHTGMRPYNLTLSDTEAIRTQGSEVRAATAFINRDDIKQQSAYESAGGQAIGAEPNYSGIRFLPLKEGRFLNDDDLRDRRRVVVLGEKSARLLFPGRPAMGEIVLLNGARFQVIGVADKSGRGNNENENQKIYIPLTTMLEMFPLKGENIPADSVTSIQYQPRIRGDNLQATRQVHEIIARRHGFDPNSKDAFNEWDTIKSEQMVGKIWTAMDCDAGAGRGRDHQHHAGFGDGAHAGDRFAQGAWRDFTEYSYAILSRGIAADRGERLCGDWRSGFVDVCAQCADGKQRAGVRSTEAGAMVGGPGDYFAQRERHCCRIVPGRQGCSAGAGRGAAARIEIGKESSCCVIFGDRLMVRWSTTVAALRSPLSAWRGGLRRSCCCLRMERDSGARSRLSLRNGAHS